MTLPNTPMQPLETHWSRALHCDLYDAAVQASASHSTHMETPMTTQGTAHEDPRLARSPLASAMILLGIYIAMYLAVAEAAHLLSPADASAAPAPADHAIPSSVLYQPASAGATGSNHATAD